MQMNRGILGEIKEAGEAMKKDRMLELEALVEKRNQGRG